MSLSGRSDLVDRHSLAHLVMRIERVSCLSSDREVTITTNTNSLIPNYSHLVMDPDKEVLNMSRYM
jgi:hypothetical protein